MLPNRPALHAPIQPAFARHGLTCAVALAHLLRKGQEKADHAAGVIQPLRWFQKVRIDDLQFLEFIKQGIGAEAKPKMGASNS